jgi:hypothetical protein
MMKTRCRQIGDPYNDLFNDIMNNLRNYFNPPGSRQLNVNKFLYVQQIDEESFDSFVQRVRDAAVVCNFEDADERIKKHK